MALAGRLTPLIPAVFAAAIAACGVVMAVPTLWEYEGDRFVLRALCQVGRGWHEIRGRTRLLLRIGRVSAAQVCVGTTAMYLSLSMVGVTDALPQALVIVLLNPLTTLTAIVPGNLGISEALVGVVVMAFGGSLADGVVAATLNRIVRFFFIILLGSYASHRLLRRAEDRPGEDLQS